MDKNKNTSDKNYLFNVKEHIELFLIGYLPSKIPQDLYEYFIIYLLIPYSFKKSSLITDVIISNDLMTCEATKWGWKTVICSNILAKGINTINIKLIRYDPIKIGVIESKHIITNRKEISDYINSYGYYSNGEKSWYNNNYIEYGDGFDKNDIIKCVLNLNNQTIEFYKNGISNGIAFKDIPKTSYQFAVSMCGSNACVKIVND